MATARFRIYNRLLAFFVGRFGRDHRKILLAHVYLVATKKDSGSPGTVR
jgi:hypothetical protein